MNRLRPAAHRWLCLVAMLVATGCLQGGCLSHRQLVQQSHGKFWSGDLPGAEAGLERALQRPKRDETVLLLDQAMVFFARGDLPRCRELLIDARDRLEQGTSLLDPGRAATWLTDDNSRPYTGEDHERVLLLTLLTLVDWVEGGGDAVAFSHQLGNQTDRLLTHRPLPDPDQDREGAKNDPPKTVSQPKVVSQPTVVSLERSASRWTAVPRAPGDPSGPATGDRPPLDPVKQELAIAPFLRATVQGASPLHLDERQRHLRQAVEWRPGSRLLMQEFLAASEARMAPVGQGSLYLVALIGRGPVKQEVVEPVTSQALLAADRILSAIGDHELPPTLAPVRIAAMTPGESAITGLTASLNGQGLGETELLSDINRLAVARHAELVPETIARAVVRRVVKKSVIVTTRENQGSQSDALNLAWNAAGVLWEATEKADLRCWSLLPGQIRVLRCDLPVGSHEIVLTPTTQPGLPPGRPLRCRVVVRDGQTTCVLASFADLDLPGQAFVSHQ